MAEDILKKIWISLQKKNTITSFCTVRINYCRWSRRELISHEEKDFCLSDTTLQMWSNISRCEKFLVASFKTSLLKTSFLNLSFYGFVELKSTKNQKIANKEKIFTTRNPDNI